jgi:hypothetical protein
MERFLVEKVVRDAKSEMAESFTEERVKKIFDDCKNEDGVVSNEGLHGAILALSVEYTGELLSRVLSKLL